MGPHVAVERVGCAVLVEVEAQTARRERATPFLRVSPVDVQVILEW